MMRGLGVRRPLYWLAALPGVAVRLWRALAARSGAGTARRSGRLGARARIDPSAVVVEAEIGEWAVIERDCQVVHSTLGPYARLDRGCHVSASTLGAYSYATVGVSLDRARIGRFCSIAAYAVIGATGHPLGRVTTHPFTYSRVFGHLRDADDPSAAAADVVIGNDVWIGTQAVVMPGVRIADGAVVGANSVVLGDVSPYEIVAGVPARRLRMRFDDQTIEALLRICWWDWSRDVLASRIADFADPTRFVRAYGPPPAP